MPALRTLLFGVFDIIEFVFGVPATYFFFSVFAGFLSYLLVWGARNWFEKRVADPLAGATLPGVLGMRNIGERTKRGTVTGIQNSTTIVVGEEREIRLIGAEVSPNPESVGKRIEEVKRVSSSAFRPHLDQRAKRWLRDFIKGEVVEIELESEIEAEAGDPIPAHVWTIDNGEKQFLVSEMMVWMSHARPVDVSHKYQERVRRAGSRAKGNSTVIPAKGEGNRSSPELVGVKEESRRRMKTTARDLMQLRIERMS